jgi:uncharacterized protein YfaP (DUF2135 family)
MAPTKIASSTWRAAWKEVDMHSRAIILLAAGIGVCAAAFAQVTIDAPTNGARWSSGEPAGFRQRVNYPASSVNAEGHAASAMIRGAIAGAPKRQPGTLIVNGVAMPLSLDETGAFQRPYSFGSGSNSVEVRAPGGSARRRVQFYDSYGGRLEARLRILLAWDTDGTDLDLHVVGPDGQHVWYGARVAADGGALDVDVTTGYGPEIYANPTPVPGVYHVFVNYYGSGIDEKRLTTAQITIVSQENTLAEKRETVTVPMRRPGELTLVKSFVYP